MAVITTSGLARVQRLLAAGGDPVDVARQVLQRLEMVKSLLGERTLNYAVKNTP
ncbi:hypothetical protein ABZS86_05860 [Streptomyces sp. NPDC005355]|uniref:hypothetical protein n=1 Tax=Streptomyces sp. NPDC005355 TaxID=3157038 RepID=UPI0033A6C8E7